MPPSPKSKKTTPDEQDGAKSDHVSQFIRLATWVKTNILATLLVLLIAGTAYGGFQVLSHVDQIIEAVKPSAKSETTSFHLAIGRGMKINSLLETVRYETNVSRLIVAEFHNGKSNLGAIPWSFSSSRHAAIAPGIAYDIDTAQSVPNTVFSETFVQIWADPKKPVCVYVKTSEVKSSLMRARLISRGTTSFVQCPIQRADGTPLGTVVASFIRDEPRDLKPVIAKIESLAKDLAPLIGKE